MITELVNIGTLLMLLLMIGVIVFMGLTGRWSSMLPVQFSKELEAMRAEVTRVTQDNDDLRADNQGLHHTVHVLARQGGEQQQRLQAMESELVTLRLERDTYARRNSVLESLFEARPGDTVLNASVLTRLRDALSTLFSVAEMQQLCADLKVDYENIEGEDKTSKAHGLVTYFERRSELATLSAAVKQRRPHARL
jgi:hypothetical protein